MSALGSGTENVRYSIVIPVHNEKENVGELYRCLAEVMRGRLESAEFIFVDDHSSDSTPDIITDLADKDSRVVLLRLKRNYGQTVALSAGFDYANGSVIISMDGDLQHDPKDIPMMISKYEETGCDIVSGWRKRRIDNFFLRRLPSRIANWCMAKISGVDIHDFGTTFKVYRAETIKQIRIFGEMHRFIPALAAWNGATIVEVPIQNKMRFGGKSHYGISRTIRVIFDLITIRFLVKYLTRPLHFFGPTGLASLTFGSVIGVWLIIKKLIYGIDLIEHHGPLLVFIAVLILGGIQLMSTGLIGELVMRTYFEALGKPLYFIERTIVGRRLKKSA